MWHFVWWCDTVYDDVTLVTVWPDYYRISCICNRWGAEACLPHSFVFISFFYHVAGARGLCFPQQGCSGSCVRGASFFSFFWPESPLTSGSGSCLCRKKREHPSTQTYTYTHIHTHTHTHTHTERETERERHHIQIYRTNISRNQRRKEKNSTYIHAHTHTHTHTHLVCTPRVHTSCVSTGVSPVSDVCLCLCVCVCVCVCVQVLFICLDMLFDWFLFCIDVCVCVCVRARACVCVCVWEREFIGDERRGLLLARSNKKHGMGTNWWGLYTQVCVGADIYLYVLLIRTPCCFLVLNSVTSTPQCIRQPEAA